jgi:hypothetical protein
MAKARDIAARRSAQQDHVAPSVRDEHHLLERIRQRTTLPWGLLPFDVF